MTGKDMQRIDRIVGNNVILTVDPRTAKEYVLFGKGIGFASRGSDWISITIRELKSDTGWMRSSLLKNIRI